ncbi:MAG: chaperone modulator CbpM [Candidatus Binataceae bacterium]|jgi:DNA-binding transcriptional MerR regulator
MARQGSRKRTTAAGRQTTLLGRSALCLMSGISERQLILWEHEQLIEPVAAPSAVRPGEPLYDATALRRARLIRTLAEELEVNLAGIDVILHLLDQIAG